MFNVQLIVSALFPLSNIIGIMAFEPIFTFDNSLGMLYDEDYGGNRKVSEVIVHAAVNRLLSHVIWDRYSKFAWFDTLIVGDLSLTGNSDEKSWFLTPDIELAMLKVPSIR